MKEKVLNIYTLSLFLVSFVLFASFYGSKENKNPKSYTNNVLGVSALPVKPLPKISFSYGENCDSFEGGCPLYSFYSQDVIASQVRTANDFFLKSVENNLNGKTVYEYWSDAYGGQALVVKTCDADKTDHYSNECKTDHSYNTQRHRIKSATVYDGMGNFVKNDFNFTGSSSFQGLAYVSSYGDYWLEGTNCCGLNSEDYSCENRTDCACPGEEGPSCTTTGGIDCYQNYSCSNCTDLRWDEYGSCCQDNYPVDYTLRYSTSDGSRSICPASSPCCLSDNTRCYSNCKLKKDKPFADYQFLGYPEVEAVTYRKNSTSLVSSKSKNFFYQALETDTCFKPSPLKGLVYKQIDYSADDASKWIENISDYRVRIGPMFGETTNYSAGSLADICPDYNPESTVTLLLPTQNITRNIIGGNATLCTKTSSSEGTDNPYALPKIDVNWGKVSCTAPYNDDTSDTAVYSYTEYTNALGDNTDETLWIAPKVKETWSSDYANISKFNHTKIYYDGQSFGILSGPGQVTKSEIYKDGTIASISTTSYKSGYPWLVSEIKSSKPSQNDPRTLITTSLIEYENIFSMYPTKITNALGHVTTTDYDFLPVADTHPNRGWQMGLPIKITDANSDTISYVYDEFGRNIQTYLPNRVPEQGNPNSWNDYYYFNEDDLGADCSIVNHCLPGLGKQLGNKTGPKYMTSNAMRYSTDSLIVSGSHTYIDGIGQSVQTRQVFYNNSWTNGGIPVDGEGNHDIIQSNTYTASGSIEYSSDIYTADPYINFQTNSFDTRNFIDDPLIYETRYTYDGFGRNTEILYPDGNKEKTVYELDGNPLKTKFQSKNCTDTDSATLCAENVSISDAFGQTIRLQTLTQDGNVYDVNTAYHSILGLPLEVRDDQNILISKFVYDSLGRKTKMWNIDLSPDMINDTSSWRYTFDPAGNLRSETNPNGVVTEYVYDNLNRITSIKTGGNLLSSTTYDFSTGCSNGKGRVCKSIDYNPDVSAQALLTTTMNYNDRGQILSTSTVTSNLPDEEVDGKTFSTNYTYDEGGRLLTTGFNDNTAMNIPDETITNTYTKPYLTSVTGISSYGKNAVFDKNSRMTSFNYGNGVAQYHTFNILSGTLTSMKATSSYGIDLMNLNYDYDPNGTIKSIVDGVDSSRTQTFTYNYLNQIQKVEGAITADYTYSNNPSLNNITSKNEGGKVVSMTYGTSSDGYYHRPESGTIDGNNVTYVYDSLGNLTSDGQFGYEYDKANRLKKVTRVALPTPTPGPTSTPTPAPYKVFVSSARYLGNLGGLAGADIKCQTLAQNAGLAGIFKAWLSTTSVDAKNRIPDKTYSLVDGTIIADNKSDLLDSSIKHAINLDENGNGINLYFTVHTGTTSDGTWMENSNTTCNNWVDSTSTFYGMRGDYPSSDYKWTEFSSSYRCDYSSRLYCFQTGSVPTPTPSPTSTPALLPTPSPTLAPTTIPTSTPIPTPSVCIPEVLEPRNMSVIQTRDVYTSWTDECSSAVIAGYQVAISSLIFNYQSGLLPKTSNFIKINGEEIGLSYQGNYSLSVRSCLDAACSRTGNWSNPVSFVWQPAKGYVCDDAAWVCQEKECYYNSDSLCVLSCEECDGMHKECSSSGDGCFYYSGEGYDICLYDNECAITIPTPTPDPGSCVCRNNKVRENNCSAGTSPKCEENSCSCIYAML